MEYKFFLLLIVCFFIATPFLMSASLEHQYQQPEFTTEVAAFMILYFGIIVWVILY